MSTYIKFVFGFGVSIEKPTVLVKGYISLVLI